MAGKTFSITEADVESLKEFIRNTVERACCKGVVVGLSGGIDSAVVTKLCVDALGPEKVLNVFMPSSVSPGEDRRVTEELAGAWGTEYTVVDIEPSVDSLVSVLYPEGETPLDRGNISARCRMAVLYSMAKNRRYLVMGTCNRSEFMMGYFTKFGDGACDVTPIADLYKTEVRQVARIIGVPEEIISKPPSAGMWEGQTDESEMGIRYSDLDSVLADMESGMDDGQISDHTGVGVSKVSDIRRQVVSMEHKRLQPLRPSDSGIFRASFRS